MVYCLILCRSLTYAQRTAKALERAGISAYITRPPRAITGEGCGHAVRVPQRRLSDALRALARVGLPAQRVFVSESDGSYREVAL